MMPDRPNGAELLEIARQVLRQELLPLIPEEHKLDALMVANTMAIAARELESGEAQRRETLTDLAGLYGEAPRPGEEAVMLAELTKRLANDIRAGKFDTGGDAAHVHAILFAAVRRRLAVSNPRYLAASQAR